MRERIEFRASLEVKKNIEEAAELTGKTVSSFVCDFIAEKAIEVINEYRMLTVNQRQWDSLMDQLERPSNSNELMDEIMRLSLEEENWTIPMIRCSP